MDTNLLTVKAENIIDIIHGTIEKMLAVSILDTITGNVLLLCNSLHIGYCSKLNICLKYSAAAGSVFDDNASLSKYKDGLGKTNTQIIAKIEKEINIISTVVIMQDRNFDIM